MEQLRRQAGAATVGHGAEALHRRMAEVVRLVDENRVERWGSLQRVQGAAFAVRGFGSAAELGRRVLIERGGDPLPGEIVAFQADEALIMPEGAADALRPGARVRLGRRPGLYPSWAWLGRVVDGLGQPLDGLGPLAAGASEFPLSRLAPPAFGRRPMGAPLETGIRLVDSFVPLCRGQRLGIFAASGVGKSTLMGMLARFVQADVVVVGLVGERGREVQDFLREALGPEGLKRAVVVVSTSDQPALARRRAAQASLAVAEFFRGEGAQVLLLLDSVTRLAQAQRDIGLAAGEPGTARSFTPSVFSELPALLERAGPGPEGEGDITAVFTVLVEGDDHDEPVADAVRGILDGHLVLDRRIGERGRWPAVDVLRSVSRALPRCFPPDLNALVSGAREAISSFEGMAEMIRLGAYRSGSDPAVDRAIRLRPSLEAFLAQGVDERGAREEAFARLAAILEGDAP